MSGGMSGSLATESSAETLPLQSCARTFLYSGRPERPSYSTCVLRWNIWPFVQVFGERKIRESKLFVERKLELLVDLDLIPGDQLVGFVGHADDRLQFVKHRVGHPLLARRRRVRGDAVRTVVGHADRDVQQLLRKRVQGARPPALLNS